MSRPYADREDFLCAHCKEIVQIDQLVPASENECCGSIGSEVCRPCINECNAPDVDDPADYAEDSAR